MTKPLPQRSSHVEKLRQKSIAKKKGFSSWKKLLQDVELEESRPLTAALS